MVRVNNDLDDSAILSGPIQYIHTTVLYRKGGCTLAGQFDP